MLSTEKALEVGMKEIVIIEWVDSSTSRINSWIDRREYEPVETISATTIGFILFEDTNTIIIAHSFSKDQYMGELAIPKCSIINRRNLQEKALEE